MLMSAMIFRRLVTPDWIDLGERIISCSTPSKSLGHDLPVGPYVAAIGRLDHVCPDFHRAAHRPGDVLRREEDLARRHVARIDVTDDGNLEAGCLANTVGDDAQSGGFSCAAHKGGDRESIGPQSHGILRGRGLLPCRIVGACHRALHDKRDLARVRRPRRSGNSLVHGHGIGLARHDRRQGRLDLPQAGRQALPVADEVIHRDRTEPAGRVREKTIQSYEFSKVHGSFSRC